MDAAEKSTRHVPIQQRAAAGKAALGHLVVVPTGGLCNRLRAIAAARRLCVEVSARCTVVWDWGRFEDYFQVMPEVTVVSEWTTTNEKVIHHHSHLADESKYRKVDVSAEAVVVYSGTVFSGTHERSFNQSVLVSSYIPQLSERMQRRVDAVKAEWPRQVVGLHVRRTDSDQSIRNSPDKLFLRAAAELIKAGFSVFLATDNVATEHKFRAAIHGALLLHKKARRLEHRWPREFDPTALEDDIVDLFLLVNCDYILGSYRSSFSHVAMALNRSPRNRILRARWPALIAAVDGACQPFRRKRPPPRERAPTVEESGATTAPLGRSPQASWASSVTVIVSISREEDWVEFMLRSLVRQCQASALEIYVVVHGSAPDLADFQVHFPSVHWLVGSAADRARLINKAIRESSGEILAFLDGRARPADDWLATAVEATIAEQTVGPSVIGGRTRIFRLSRRKLRPHETLAAYVTPVLNHKRSISRKNGAFVDMGHMIVPRSVFGQVGPLDETLHAAADIEWAARARARGIRLRYAHSSVLWLPPPDSFLDVVLSQCQRVRELVRLVASRPELCGSLRPEIVRHSLLRSRTYKNALEFINDHERVAGWFDKVRFILQFIMLQGRIHGARALAGRAVKAFAIAEPARYARSGDGAAPRAEMKGGRDGES